MTESALAESSFLPAIAVQGISTFCSRTACAGNSSTLLEKASEEVQGVANEGSQQIKRSPIPLVSSLVNILIQGDSSSALPANTCSRRLEDQKVHPPNKRILRPRTTITFPTTLSDAELRKSGDTFVYASDESFWISAEKLETFLEPFESQSRGRKDPRRLFAQAIREKAPPEYYVPCPEGLMARGHGYHPLRADWDALNYTRVIGLWRNESDQREIDYIFNGSNGVYSDRVPFFNNDCTIFGVAHHGEFDTMRTMCMARKFGFIGDAMYYRWYITKVGGRRYAWPPQAAHHCPICFLQTLAWGQTLTHLMLDHQKDEINQLPLQAHYHLYQKMVLYYEMIHRDNPRWWFSDHRNFAKDFEGRCASDSRWLPDEEIDRAIEWRAEEIIPTDPDQKYHWRPFQPVKDEEGDVISCPRRSRRRQAIKASSVQVTSVLTTNVNVPLFNYVSLQGAPQGRNGSWTRNVKLEEVETSERPQKRAKLDSGSSLDTGTESPHKSRQIDKRSSNRRAVRLVVEMKTESSSGEDRDSV